MNTNDETSLTKAADPASVFIGSTLDTSTGSVAFNGLEKGDALTANTVYPVNATPIVAAEEQAVPPVASDERNMEICAWCGFMMHYGRGPISHGICPSCREMFFPEVPHAP